MTEYPGAADVDNEPADDESPKPPANPFDGATVGDHEDETPQPE